MEPTLWTRCVAWVSSVACACAFAALPKVRSLPLLHLLLNALCKKCACLCSSASASSSASSSASAQFPMSFSVCQGRGGGGQMSQPMAPPSKKTWCAETVVVPARWKYQHPSRIARRSTPFRLLMPCHRRTHTATGGMGARVGWEHGMDLPRGLTSFYKRRRRPARSLCMGLRVRACHASAGIEFAACACTSSQ